VVDRAQGLGGRAGAQGTWGAGGAPLVCDAAPGDLVYVPRGWGGGWVAAGDAALAVGVEVHFAPGPLARY
jgi:oxalate decarboxylase/phosphoglucose isomerase-like protein (cupin superfamily)